MTMTKYQLVLQLPASCIDDYDAMVELEEAIVHSLASLGRVDGHDAGSGEMNIFILTNHPRPVFDRIKQLPGMKDFMPDLKVAYREVGKEDFTILYPAGLTYFAIA
jgi:hypothetical protein